MSDSPLMRIDPPENYPIDIIPADSKLQRMLLSITDPMVFTMKEITKKTRLLGGRYCH